MFPDCSPGPLIPSSRPRAEQQARRHCQERGDRRRAQRPDQRLSHHPTVDELDLRCHQPDQARAQAAAGGVATPAVGSPSRRTASMPCETSMFAAASRLARMASFVGGRDEGIVGDARARGGADLDHLVADGMAMLITVASSSAMTTPGASAAATSQVRVEPFTTARLYNGAAVAAGAGLHGFAARSRWYTRGHEARRHRRRRRPARPVRARRTVGPRRPAGRRPRAPTCEAVLVALDPTTTALDEAARRGCQALLVHHPLVFEPLAAVTADAYPGSLILRAAQARASP